MSDGLNPSGPAQPNLDQAYETKGNAASKEPAESRSAQQNATDNSAPTDERIPTKQTSSIDEATPSSMGRGVRGAGPGEESKGLTHEDVGRHNELEPAALGTYAEDQIADAVKGTQSGAGGKEKALGEDLERKKAEQAPLRAEKYAEKEKEVDVGGILGQRGGPANPVDKGNYPNSGD